MSRRALINGGDGDPRRDIDAECGYPREIDVEMYRKLYDREPIASRVVQVLPMECWQVTPSVYEDEDVEVVTPFEQAFHDLPKMLRGESWFQDEEGSPLWEAMMRLDILSGIGSYGVALLGIDDGLRLDQPVDGFVDSPQSMSSIGTQQTGLEAERGALSMMPRKRIDPYEQQQDSLQGGSLRPTRNVDEFLSEYARMVFEQEGGIVTNAFPKKDPNEEGDTGSQEDVVPEEGMPADPQQGVMPSKNTNDRISGDQDLGDFNGEAPVTERKLLFIRVFDESLIQVLQYEADPTSVRFGQPVMYQLTLNDPQYLKGGSGLSMNTARVHWSRILHVADNLGSSEVFGVPRMQPVYNRLLDLRKLHSGSAEMYWKGAFPGYNLVTHPQLGGDVSFDSEDIKNQMEQYMNGLQRYTAFIGSQLNSLAPQVVDPTTQIQVQLEAICVRLAVPMRVFMGSERGELASSQDAGTWNDRLKQRQNGYLTPRLIVPLVDRLIKMKVLPEPNYVAPEPVMPEEDPEMGQGMQDDGMGTDTEEPSFDQQSYTGNAFGQIPREAYDDEEGMPDDDMDEGQAPPSKTVTGMEKPGKQGGYSVVWPDLSAASDLEKAQKASQMTMALSSYVSGGVENVMTFPDFLVHVMGMDEQLAQQIFQNSMEQGSNEMMSIDPGMEQQMAEAQMQQMTDPELVPDNIQTGDQHHYEAGSMDKQFELDHERQMMQAEQGPPGQMGQPPGGENPVAGGPPKGGKGQGKPPTMLKGKGKVPGKDQRPSKRRGSKR